MRLIAMLDSSYVRRVAIALIVGFSARAEALPAFRAAPPQDGVTAVALGD